MGYEKNIEWAWDYVLQLAQERVVKLCEGEWNTEVTEEPDEMLEAISMVVEFDFDSPETSKRKRQQSCQLTSHTRKGIRWRPNWLEWNGLRLKSRS